MNISCKVIRDLLPLYHDNVCSDESKSLVEEHLKNCEGCRGELQLIEAEINAPHITPESKHSMKAISSAWKKAKKKSFAKGLFIAASALIALIVVFNLSFGVERMEGPSMSTSIAHNEVCLFSKFAYSFKNPEHGDIISVRVTISGRGYNDIARIVAIPGDTVLIEGGTLYINGEASSLFKYGEVVPFDMDGEVMLGADEYFVMGDNQAHSVDSRSNAYGLISGHAIIGKLLTTVPLPSNLFVQEANNVARD